jgi:AcrR family transcriptional regulator
MISDNSPPLSDGRHRRTKESRERIVAAMTVLIGSGQLRPSAEAVAAQAQVGLRSVFRHFKDMESLYVEMAAGLVRFYQPAMQAFESEDWRGRLFEALDRRIETYEKLQPFKRAADMRAYESEAIRASNTWIRQVLRSRLPLFLPPHLIDDAVALETLDMLIGFESWVMLRNEQNLSSEAARAVIEGLLKAFLDAPAVIAR